jgi:hypothetical protein
VAANRGRLRALIAVTAGLLMAVAVPTMALAAPTDPGTALNTAVSNLEGQGYNVSGTVGSTAAGGSGPITATGTVDSNAKLAAAEFKGVEGGDPVDIHFVQTPNDLYVKIDIKSIQSRLGVTANQWVKVDEAKVTDPSNLPFDMSGSTDAINIAGLLKSVSDVAYANPSDPSRITGTVDLTAATGVGAPNPGDLKAAGAAAKTTPFVATVDGQGRLTELKIDADKFDGNLTQDLAFTDYGSPDQVTVPTDSVPAPAPVYMFFNG